MEKDAVQDSGLAPQESGGEAVKPQGQPGIQGKEIAPEEKVNRLYRELKRWREKYRELEAHRSELGEREKALEELKSRLADERLGRVLTGAAAAQDAINPRQVALFLRPRVALDEDLKSVVVTPEGAKEDGSGPATVEELISEFLSRYPYHRKAKLSGGSGSAPSPSAVADTLKEQIKSASSHEELQRIVSRKQP